MIKKLLITSVCAGAALISNAQVVTMSPANADMNTQITLTLDVSQACAPGAPIDPAAANAYMHSGVGFDPDPNVSKWNNVVQKDNPAAIMFGNGAGLFTISLIPATYYSVTAPNIAYHMDMVFCQQSDMSTWTNEAKGFDVNGGCTDIFVPLAAPQSLDAPVSQLVFLACNPNPVSTNAKLGYSLVNNNNSVSLKLYDIVGNLVKTIVDSEAQIGRKTYVYEWNADNNAGGSVANGIYFLRLEANGSIVSTQKVNVNR